MANSAGNPPAPETAGPGGTPVVISIEEGLDENRGALLARLKRIADHSPRSPRYRVIDPIARGGMGEVLRIWDNDLKRELAMKRIAAGIDPNSSAEERENHEHLLSLFIEEARVTSRLDHPGIVPVHEIAIDRDGAIYFTMPLVRGQDLEATLKLVRHPESDWNRSRVLGVLLRVCETVAFAHDRKVVHRDLKPSNIMVGPFGEAYVMDWGLALVSGRCELQGIVGTPAFMSPEQAGLVDAEVGPLSDVYSLGAILYQILTERMPHEPSTTDASGVDTAWIDVPPVPPEKIDPSLSPELVAICRKAMERRPAERYAGVEEMASDLRAYLEGHVVGAYESGLLARTRKWVGRNRGLANALQALFVLALVAPAALIVQQDRNVRALRRENEETTREQYAASLRAADLSLRIPDPSDAAFRLRRTPEKLRGWEWEHLQLKADASRLRVEVQDPLQQAGRLEDGRIVVRREDGGIDLWDLERGSGQAFFRDADPIRSLAVSPDRRRLAAGSEGGVVSIWNRTDQPARSLSLAKLPIDLLAFGPEARRLAVVDQGGRVQVLDLSSGKLVSSFQTTHASMSALAFSPDGQRIWVTHRDSVHVWDVRAGARVGTSEELGQGLLSIAVHPDGHSIALGAIDHTIHILDGASLQQRAVWSGHGGGVSSVAYHPSGERLVSASHDNTIRIWDARTGTEETQLIGHRESVTWAEFGARGDEVLSVSLDETIRSWDPHAQACTVLTGHDAGVASVAFLGHTDRLISSSLDGTLRIWDADGGAAPEVLPTEQDVFAIAIHPDGERAALSRREGVHLLQLATGDEERLPGGHTADVQELAFDTRGEKLLSRAFDGVRLWRVEAREEALVLPFDQDWGGALAFHPDSKSFASASQESGIGIWSSADGQELTRLRYPEGYVYAVAFSHSGELLAASTTENLIVLWRRGRGDRWRRVEGEGEAFLGHDNLIPALAFSPDDQRLVSGSTDGTVRIWHPSSGELLLTLEGHVDGVNSVAFSRDGKKIASGSSDHTIRVWNTERPASH